MNWDIHPTTPFLFSFTSCQKIIHQHLRLFKASFLPPNFIIFPHILLQSYQWLPILATWTCKYRCDASKQTHATLYLLLSRYINIDSDVDLHEQSVLLRPESLH